MNARPGMVEWLERLLATLTAGVRFQLLLSIGMYFSNLRGLNPIRIDYDLQLPELNNSSNVMFGVVVEKVQGVIQ